MAIEWITATVGLALLLIQLGRWSAEREAGARVTQKQLEELADQVNERLKGKVNERDLRATRELVDRIEREQMRDRSQWQRLRDELQGLALQMAHHDGLIGQLGRKPMSGAVRSVGDFDGETT